MGCMSSKPKTDEEVGQAPSKDTKPKSPSNKGSKSGKGASDSGVKHGDGVAFMITSGTKAQMDAAYNVDKNKLGEGSYGSVYKCTNKRTHVACAVKSISKKLVKNESRLKAEINIMKMLDHPNCIKLYETFEDHKNIYLIMEQCNGGELFDAIIDNGNFTEKEAAAVMQQIFRGIYYLHKMYVVHRDLKPENFLFSEGKQKPIGKRCLKIIDFGLSMKFTPGSTLATKAGTPYYVAPQVLMGKYSPLCDIWSCGVIMYVLCCGYPPFSGENDAEVLAKVRKGNFDFATQDWKDITQDCKELIKSCLKLNESQRYTADKCLEHSWIKNKAPGSSNKSISADIAKNIKAFANAAGFKKRAITMMARNLSPHDCQQLNQIFSDMDTNGDGHIDKLEWTAALQRKDLNMTAEQKDALTEMWVQVDRDGNGTIEYTEFLAVAMDKSRLNNEEALYHIFSQVDKDASGEIDISEFAQLMTGENVKNLQDLTRASFTDESIKEMEREFAQADEDGSGTISFQEFCTYMQDTYKV